MAKGHLNDKGDRMNLDRVGAEKFRRACDNGGYCVEVAIAEAITVRDSKAVPHGPVLRFTRTEWDEFITAVKVGKFDLDLDLD
jgi:uncharacterized protein DUF397